ncbi:acyl-CoA thioesterase [Aquimarina sp. D1M17]|uniref:acyl-CoA thioesterase n=1 Tax=Aquimarina acroporae TaxID=2937283 RepID=UPI0020C0DCB0|nr:acyl-CoA thioesterase [Aquimarina acroporae]MCK8522367.1 acyl-CoA thioesterase [Aquimarina acroporae]
MPMIKTNESAYYEYNFNTTFEETNLVGNIYFANYIVWQGKCREMFLYENCPDVIEEINNGLALITLDVSVKYLGQLRAFDRVSMHMTLEAQNESRLLMGFRYYKKENSQLHLVCEGTQATAAMKEINGKMVPVPFPESMFEIFSQYQII